MNSRSRTAFFLVVIISVIAVSVASSQDKFKLKPGAKGKICLNCHPAFAETLNRRFVHTPVKAGDCSDCHNPHTSSHGKLLAEDVSKICNTCHDGIVPEKARSAHKIALEGNCVKCHDPHASNNKFNLTVAGNDLCFQCHKSVAESVSGNKFKHSPVEKGCLACHNPHASSEAVALLETGVPSLCTKCHKTDRKTFARHHGNYPVAKTVCTSCHNPHGSSVVGILWDNVHPPVTKQMCNQCHFPSSSPDALKTKRIGYELCRGCHNDMVNDTFRKDRIHWPLVDKSGCLNCHSPHASKEAGLLKEPLITVCGTCHADTIERQEKSLTKHEPITEGNCTECHSPHSSDQIFLFESKNVIDLCGTCHDWQKHSSHPIGEKIKDKRNENLSLDCVSCHRSHGTEFKNFMHFSEKSDVCVQCHIEHKR